MNPYRKLMFYIKHLTTSIGNNWQNAWMFVGAEKRWVVDQVATSEPTKGLAINTSTYLFNLIKLGLVSKWKKDTCWSESQVCLCCSANSFSKGTQDPKIGYWKERCSLALYQCPTS